MPDLKPGQCQFKSDREYQLSGCKPLVDGLLWEQEAVGSRPLRGGTPTIPTRYALVMEQEYIPVLETGFCRFDSCQGHSRRSSYGALRSFICSLLPGATPGCATSLAFKHCKRCAVLVNQTTQGSTEEGLHQTNAVIAQLVEHCPSKSETRKRVPRFKSPQSLQDIRP